jgi:transposase-like protein
MKSELDAPHFADEEAAIAYVEAWIWPDGPTCPHCGTVGEASRSKGKTTRLGLWNCRACRKPFTVRMGTIVESSHVPMRIWLQAIYLICSSKKGISTRQIHRTLGGSMKTAWFLMHRIRHAMDDSGSVNPRGGEGKFVEADETYIGGKAKNRAYKAPPPKEAVVSLVERGGKVRSRHVPEVTAQTLKPILVDAIAKDTHFRTDESPVYYKIGEGFKSHLTVNHSIKEYVRGDAFTNTAEGYFSILKRGIYGIYHHVSAAHLPRYLAEFDFRYNNRVKLGVGDTERAARVLVGAKGKRLTYQSTREQDRLDTPPF